MIAPAGRRVSKWHSGMTTDAWTDGKAYERYVGRWSRRVAEAFIRWLGVRPHGTWLDFGCGTGALAQTILATADPALVTGCDRSPGYVAYARHQTPDARANFRVAELPDLPRTGGGFDAVVSGLVLNFLPSPADGVGAMASRARVGGTIAAYVWDYAEGMEFMRVFWDAAIALDGTARELDEGVRFPLCRPDALLRLFEGAGLHGVEVQPITVPTIFQRWDDYWTPFLGGQGPAPSYVKTLPPERRVELGDAIRRRLPAAPDGTIRLHARAWAAKGIAA